MSLAEMRKELRELRKSSKEHAPVSRMKKNDITSELERLRHMRETTAHAAATGAPPLDKRMEPKHRSIKEAKEATDMAHSHPVAHAAPAAAKKEKAAPAKKKSGGKLAALMKMLEEMSSSDEE